MTPTVSRSGWAHRDDGSATAEVTLVTSILIMILVLAGVYVHRGVDARIRINDVANQAARAASLQRTPDQARAEARTTATAALSSAGLACRSLNVTTAADLQPGGTVTVDVSCTVDFGDAILLGASDSQQLSASAVAPVDTWRSTITQSGAHYAPPSLHTAAVVARR
jgi:Flp pilus assembly protein TadG